MTSSPESSPATDVGWYYLHEGKQLGPLAEQDLLELARQGLIAPETLVWQPGFNQRWKQAASIPMLAVNLGCFGVTRRGRSEALPRHPAQRTKLVTETLSELERLTPADLGEAVNDEEAAESLPDAREVHEILERASRPPPARGSHYSSERASRPPLAGGSHHSSERASRPPVGNDHHSPERSIPPASVGASIAPLQKRPATAYLLALAASSVLIGIGAVFFLVRPHRTSAPPESLNNTAEQRPAANGSGPAANGSGPAANGSGPAANGSGPAASATASVDEPRAEKRPETQADPVHLTPSQSMVEVTSGPLDEKAFEAKLRRALPMFEHQCWEKLRLPLDGVTDHPEVRVEISVDRTGRVYDVTSSKAPRGYHGAGLCIIGRMRGWRFPQAEQGTRAVMTVGRVHD